MQYSIENDILRLTVDSHGAEPVSVIHKPTGAELLWQADPAVWKRHAPILFPWTGKLPGGTFEAAKCWPRVWSTQAVSTALPAMSSTR